jgi:hypothetical protein
MSNLYKVTGPKAEAIHDGRGRWFTPHGNRPGKWMPEVKDPRCCERGYHLVELYSLPEWLRADCRIYLAEGRGAQHSDGSGKTAFAQARLLQHIVVSDKDLRLFAADCAEHVLPIFLKVRPNDYRPAEAIEAARAYARGEIGAAAWDAARAAARAAAWDAAWAAARDAAGDAARAAAWDAAWAAERQWQSERLGSYLTRAPLS